MTTARREAPLTCAVIVLNWNGRSHLEVLLPSLYEARHRWGQPLPIVVVDNRSSADDVRWLRSEHPEVEVVVAERNDFLFSLNPAVSARPEDIVIVLNNDMRVDRDFIAPLVAHFADSRVFAVAASVWNWDGKDRQLGQRRFEIRRNWLRHWFDPITKPCYTAEAGGGCSAYRRRYFSALGGFDGLYRPAYWEDFDLTYRAWLRGWSSVIEPASVIYHCGSATLTEVLARGRMGRILSRNQFLFITKNIGGWGFVAGVLARLPHRLAFHALHGNWSLVWGQLSAVPRIPAALLSRWRRTPPLASPEDIMAALDHPVNAADPVAAGTARASGDLCLAPLS